MERDDCPKCFCSVPRRLFRVNDIWWGNPGFLIQGYDQTLLWSIHLPFAPLISSWHVFVKIHTCIHSSSAAPVLVFWKKTSNKTKGRSKHSRANMVECLMSACLPLLKRITCSSLAYAVEKGAGEWLAPMCMTPVQ